MPSCPRQEFGQPIDLQAFSCSVRAARTLLLASFERKPHNFDLGAVGAIEFPLESP
jgi:hypothetical protein